ncbi:MAG: helix-hairpin-helix domain-containing protein, partial [Bacteroidota bacterium]
PAAKRGPGRPASKTKAPKSPLEAINGVGPPMAKKFEEAGIKTPAKFASLSNAKMSAILANCGPRYRNATPEKMQGYRDAAKAAK